MPKAHAATSCATVSAIDSLFMKTISKAKADDCRPEGYNCEHSGQCCGYCSDGECHGGSGGGSCRPEGANCEHSGQCCGYCSSGECRGGSDSGCRREGLRCDHSGQCCGYCSGGECHGG